MIKKSFFILFVAVALLVMPSLALSKPKVDSFQQVMNYLVSGDPFKDIKRGPFYVYKAKIFNRKKCIAGWEDDKGGYVKYYFNKAHTNSLAIQDKFVGGVWRKHLQLSGSPYVVKVNIKNQSLKVVWNILGMRNSRYASVLVPLGKVDEYDNDRLTKAIQLLYTKHCRGRGRNSAF